MIEVGFTAGETGINGDRINGDRSIFPRISRRICIAGDGKIDLSPFIPAPQAILEISWNS
jgi:hypothetical protein